MTHVATAQLIGPRHHATLIAQQLRDAGWRGPISLAAHNPQPYNDIDDNDEAAS